MKEQYRIHQLGNTAYSARFDPLQVKSAAQSSWWIEYTLIKDFMQNMYIVISLLKIVLILFKILSANCVQWNKQVIINTL